MTGVEIAPLAGYTVGVTAARRAEEFAVLLERRGATVVRAPAIRIEPLADDARLLATTRHVVATPVDVVVATTGIGFRGWIEAAEGWGLGTALLRGLADATILARGPKARGAVRAAGLVETFTPASERSEDLLRHLLDIGVRGRRVAVQLHGEPLTWFLDALRGAGADVVAVPVYRWTPTADQGPVERLVDGVLGGQVDVLAFTSAPAVLSVLRIASRSDRLDPLVHVLRRRAVAACVGEVTAGPLAALDVPVVRPDRARIGALVREIVAVLPSRADRLRVGRHTMELRGQAVLVDGEFRPVPPAPMAVLRALATRPGTVVSRPDLLATLPGAGEEHAVETAVARLRTALGEPNLVQTVVKRGYRLACGR
ncbi:MAG TPA: uroporphyrinogen-III synthase [Pseudonocardiaceae bacterium]|nr:uroporphyrinogen-III synthase [Pseudonocardiaceae bacterium]